MKKIDSIREKEKTYHTKLYKDETLFNKGTWLEKPVKTVIDTFELVKKHDKLVILDIGSGVGRNAIPMAELIKDTSGIVVCIDLLNIAISKLNDYAELYKVKDRVKGIQSSIEEYEYGKDKYDYVIAVSSLEHISSVSKLIEVLREISSNTVTGGINYFILNTSVFEFDKAKGIELEPQFEINLESKDMSDILEKCYGKWNIIKNDIKRHKFDIVRDDNPVLMDTTVLTFIAKKIELQ